ncbi:hypothetical protein [Mesorhizobium sp. M0091]|uniref:hypothetical protein n=1 Tax=Mesorhizobium sp. M0091 TaxID=2956875 RepID=UPI00333BFF34
MTIRPPEFAYARFSTAMWPRAEWRNVYCDLLRRMVTDMDFNVTEEKLSVDATILRLPGVGIADSRTTAFRTIRSSAMAKGTDDYIFFMCLEGAATSRISAARPASRPARQSFCPPLIRM